MRILYLEQGKPDKEVCKLLTDNLIGTPGKSLVYQHMKVSEKLAYIVDPFFLSVKIGGKTVGTACFIPRETHHRSASIPSYYIRYFAFRNAFRSSSGALDRMDKNSLLKNEIKEVLTGKPLGAPDPHLIYAYVDPDNVRSRRIIDSFGFREVGRFKTVFFSRFWPKISDKVEISSERDWQTLQQQIRDFYKDYGFYTSANLGYQQGYYVYRNKGQIVAGLQAKKEHWKIHEIPEGKHLISWVSRIPLLNRIFHRDFKFLSLEGIFYLPGFEDRLPVLLEHVLATSGRHTAIACVDPDTELYHQLHGLDLGFVQQLTSEKEMAVVARGEGVNWEWLKGNPVYVSAFDNM